MGYKAASGEEKKGWWVEVGVVSGGGVGTR
jgi:hypothetical protein